MYILYTAKQVQCFNVFVALDEENFCDDKQFRCDNGICQPSDYECDNFNDCGDNSDEEDCPTSKCMCVDLFISTL